ncbi:hypothetical protein [Streptomyces bicolor]|nr:hypothetical protein [Streptomyces bicolor]
MEEIRHVRFDHSDAVKLSALAQAEYMRRYGLFAPDRQPRVDTLMASTYG